MCSRFLRKLILYFSLLMLVASCGEPVPVDCTPDEEQCATETEGGFETGTVAGIAAGGAAVVALAAGGISSDDGGSSGSGSSTTNNNGSSSNTGPILTGTLIDSAVAGVSYQTNSNLSGLTSVNGSFEYRGGDQVTFQIGGTFLGTVTGGAVITPVELAGVSNTADRRVINIARLLQSLDEDQDPSNGININSTTRSAMAGRSIVFDVPVSSFSSNENVLQLAIGKGLVASEDVINHLHGSLTQEGRPGYVATEAAIQQLVPSFVAESVSGGTGTTSQSCNFAGGTVPDGGNVIAYQSESVAAGGTCSSQTRVCSNGQLSGSYAYTSCQVEQATDCQFNGNSIANGQSVTAYQSATVPFGSTCTSQTRSCSNGILSGSYSFSNCEEAEPLDCTFNGSMVEHGYSIKAYQKASVNSGVICVSENRICENGVLSGSYNFSSCDILNKTGWTKQIGTSSNDFGSNISSDLSGNIYVAGFTDGQFEDSTNDSKGDAFVVKYNNIGIKQWTRQVGTSDSHFADVTSDSLENVYVTGYTQGSLNGNPSAGRYDLFIVKYDSTGSRQWTQQLGTYGNDGGHSITVDPSGNVYVVGFTWDSLDENTSAGGTDILLVKYNNIGIKQWTRQVGTASTDVGYSITSDSLGNLYVTGYVSGEINDQISAGKDDIFLAKYNKSGERQWIQQFGTPEADYGHSITSDSLGNLYVTGVTLGALGGNTNLGNEDVFLAKYNTRGERQWIQQFGTPEADYGRGISADKLGNVYLTGYTDGSLDGQSSTGGRDLFIAKYNSNGEKKWIQQLGSPETDLGIGITVDSSANIYATGTTWGDLDGNVNIGEGDVFLVKYNTEGVKQ